MSSADSTSQPTLGSGIEHLPEEQRATLKKAIRYEWITIGVILATVVIVGLVAGQSQAMKSAWSEDIISLVPALAFLIAIRILRRPQAVSTLMGHTAPSQWPTWCPVWRCLSWALI